MRPTMKKTLLLVEDDRLVLHMLSRGLSDEGYHVLEADSGESAMQLCTFHRPDIAILDMSLPGMSGVIFAQWLKSTLKVPFLFLSAFNDARTVNTAAELGALGYLVKPLDVPQVLPAIHTALLRAEEIRALHQAELDLNKALKSSRSISVAVGLLMRSFDSSADATFDALRAYCRGNQIRMQDVADKIVECNQNIDLTPYFKK